MIKYLIEQTVKKEVRDKGKKMVIYTGVALTGVGVFLSYKAMKKIKERRDNNYLEDNEYDVYGCGCENHDLNEEFIYGDESCGCHHEHTDEHDHCGCHHEHHNHENVKPHNHEGCGCHHDEFKIENSELEKKIDEFNSRRINEENTNDADENEMESKLNKVKDSKDEVVIKDEDYIKEQYDEYDEN